MLFHGASMHPCTSTGLHVLLGWACYGSVILTKALGKECCGLSETSGVTSTCLWIPAFLRLAEQCQPAVAAGFLNEVIFGKH